MNKDRTIDLIDCLIVKSPLKNSYNFVIKEHQDV